MANCQFSQNQLEAVVPAEGLLLDPGVVPNVILADTTPYERARRRHRLPLEEALAQQVRNVVAPGGLGSNPMKV